ncbi:hypothetical protein D3C87_1039620 [compost metagenome]
MASKSSLLLITASLVLAQHNAEAAKTCEKLFKNSAELEFLELTPIRAAKMVKTEVTEVSLNEVQVKFIARSHNLFIGKFPPRLEALTKAELKVIGRQVEKSGGGRLVELLPEEVELLKASQVQTDPRELVQLMGITKKDKKILSSEMTVHGRTGEELVIEAQNFISRHNLKEIIVLLTHPLIETKLASETALISPLKITELEVAQKLSALTEAHGISVRIRASLPAGHAYEASFERGIRVIGSAQ